MSGRSFVPPAIPYRLIGTVRVEGTGEPVAGAKLRIHVGDVFDSQGPNQRLVESGADGAFAVDLPAGPFQVSHAVAPIGYYWAESRPGTMESLLAGPVMIVSTRGISRTQGHCLGIPVHRQCRSEAVAGTWLERAVDREESFEAHERRR